MAYMPYLCQAVRYAPLAPGPEPAKPHQPACLLYFKKERQYAKTA
jgi:hypothetical protein